MGLLSELSTTGLVYLVLAAVIIGFTKTSVGGVGTLAVLLIALAFPGKASPGILLPMALFADIMAVIYYRRDCQWRILLRLMPVTFVGVIIGYLIFDFVPVDAFETVIGVVILAMLVLSLVIDGQNRNYSQNRLFTWFFGATAGVTSMIANAAGPVFAIYLLQMGLKKSEFVGTRSWFYLLINMIKIPFSIHLGLITTSTVTLNVMMLPIILLGAFIGIKVLKMINLELFKLLTRVIIFLAAIRLILF